MANSFKLVFIEHTFCFYFLCQTTTKTFWLRFFGVVLVRLIRGSGHNFFGMPYELPNVWVHCTSNTFLVFFSEVAFYVIFIKFEYVSWGKLRCRNDRKILLIFIVIVIRYFRTIPIFSNVLFFFLSFLLCFCSLFLFNLLGMGGFSKLPSRVLFRI